MKYLISLLFVLPVYQHATRERAEFLTLSKDSLRNKISGGWAGQAIGVAFGIATKSNFKEDTIEYYEPVAWNDGYLRETFQDNPGLYDHLYMDIAFVEVFDNQGMEAPVDAFAEAYAHAEYSLRHVNPVARDNILNGLVPPASGHWLHNPHADDIDFQIKADFAGLMSPGMSQAAAAICDKVGHIMNYGDGYYGGLYMATLYSLAFTSDDVAHIVSEAATSIPLRSKFRQCINDVIRWQREFPDDWKRAWIKIQNEWSDDVGCPDGFYDSLSADAKLNAAYVTMALLYGKGDFSRTLEIAVRSGRYPGCNAASAGGILGVILGYDNIPARCRKSLEDVESLPFKYTTLALNDVYEASYRHALAMIEENDGKVRHESVIIRIQKPREAPLERSFEGHQPIERRSFNNVLAGKEFHFEFEGIGFLLKGEALTENESGGPVEAELYLNNKFIETVILSANVIGRKSDLYWKYQLPHRKHHVRLKVLNPGESKLKVTDVVVYDVSLY